MAFANVSYEKNVMCPLDGGLVACSEFPNFSEIQVILIVFIPVSLFILYCH